MCVQDETVVIADDRLRKGVYTPKKKRAVYEYTGNHAKAMQFGLKAADGRVHIGRHDRFTKDEFVEFLRNARAKFGKMVMILDRAPPAHGKGGSRGDRRDGRRGQDSVPSPPGARTSTPWRSCGGR